MLHLHFWANIFRQYESFLPIFQQCKTWKGQSPNPCFDATVLDDHLTAYLECFNERILNIHGGPKNVPLYFCPYLRQLLTDFPNSFTGTLCKQFVVM